MMLHYARILQFESTPVLSFPSQAEESSKSNRAMKCIMILVTINMLLIVEASGDSGPRATGGSQQGAREAPRATPRAACVLFRAACSDASDGAARSRSESQDAHPQTFAVERWEERQWRSLRRAHCRHCCHH